MAALLGGAVPEPAQAPSGRPGAQARADGGQPLDVLEPRDGESRSIGPGRVVLQTTPDERWVAFSIRGSHRVLAERGGFVVFAQGRDGRLVEIADSRRGDLPATTPEPLPAVHEGAPGGARYPSANPDDDGDGKVDEDRLDGVDNDGDGKVDEDYAAIGDEMIATTCATPSGATAPNLAPDGQQPQVPAVELHEECYGWSLSHLDGMIAVKLTVRNTGGVDLTDLRVGAAFERRGAFEVGTQDITGAAGGAAGFGRPLSAKAMVLRDGANSLAVLFVSERSDRGETSWITGVTAVGRPLVDVVRAATRPDVLTRPDHTRAAAADTETGDAAPEDAEAQPDTRVAYGVSPNLGTLEPGETVDVYFALVAAGSGERESRAVDDAYRTIYGDGQHRFIPPPLSITRRVLWGTYEIRVPGDPSAGVSVTLSDPRAQGIDPVEINALRGLDMRSATRTVDPSGNVDIEVTGAVPEEMRAGRRVTLDGRTQGGEPFEVVLQPLSRRTMDAAAMAADTYWNAPGKLEETLLSSSPNPFREATTVDFEVPAQIVTSNGQSIRFSGSVEASVKVYNVVGRLVDTLMDTTLGPGHYSVTWEARDAAGSTVASGVYYLRLQIGKKYITKRLTQIR